MYNNTETVSKFQNHFITWQNSCHRLSILEKKNNTLEPCPEQVILKDKQYDGATTIQEKLSFHTIYLACIDWLPVERGHTQQKDFTFQVTYPLAYSVANWHCWALLITIPQFQSLDTVKNHFCHTSLGVSRGRITSMVLHCKQERYFQKN
jgi:hypothetical protein